MSDTWTIGELAERAARALRAGAQPVNGRVRDVPGERLIRWYTTIGLVDPPLTRRGRIARYGRRHLLQLVAVKRMQAAGHSIAQIQTALAGATDTTLEAAAGVDGAHVPHRPGEGDAPRARFWAERPGRPAPTTSEGPLGDGHVEGGPAGGGVVAGVVLQNGVRVLWDGGRPPSEEDVQAVLAAAGPLLAVLVERRLL
ncbi:MerR family transcriptional regulator [Nonomuraea spiralis]|uniref:helix-turn-helix domain-containing protein n=1 Tax=Nonomuraea TaxID=83681 RepID=UPI000F777ED1|nr:helix-turn-helix domain-containing protein [Nonomuraea sp. WAC 01424]RSN15981.1 MerR family transcriptional regulator [Nonomuraea sp. WAC 01424]